jgi:N-acetylglutamate synthase-like GNAT family acetyltransferase
MTNVVIRRATPADAEALHALITSHLDEGHLLPRALDELRAHAERFLVCDLAGAIVACAELAPLSRSVAEVRSLVVSRDARRGGLARRLVVELRDRAKGAGYDTLCAFTHDARFFVRQNFSIVPHVWLPEKIMTDCQGCPLFRRCRQYAMILPLDEMPRYGSVNRSVAAVA